MGKATVMNADLMLAGSKGGNMHSHDRTLIASLGFADPDKGRREHELAIP
jgi:hypothetical protein